MTRLTGAGPVGDRTVVGMSAVLDGRTALVTGAGSGIGAAVARRLVADGAKVYAVDLAEDRVAPLAAESDLVTPLGCDLSDLDAVEQLPTDVDILVNNAGRQHVSRLEEFDPEMFSNILRLMLESPFRLIRRSLPHMYARGWGRVVNISSAHGLRASPFKSAYVSAKHGLEGLSKVTALEGAEHGVTSNCINPAYVRTPLVEAQIADQARTHGISEDEVVTKIMILTHPANEFVAEFVGAGAAVRRLSLLELSRLELQSVDLDGTAARNGSPTYEADAEGRPVRWAYLPGTADLPKLVTVPRTGTVYDAVDVMLDSQTELVGVVDEQEKLQGALWWRDLVEGLKTKAGS